MVNAKNCRKTLISDGDTDILLEMRLSGVAGLRYTMLYGKSQVNDMSVELPCRIPLEVGNGENNAK